MRTAVLTDVHANLEALSACLSHAERNGAERFIFLGDHVGYGADPGLVVDMIRERVARGGLAVLGNHDLAVIQTPGEGMHAAARTAIQWTRERLTADQLQFLAALPLTVREDGHFYVHANASAPGQWEYVTGVYDAGKSIRATDCRITFCGHVHTPALYHMTADGRVFAFTPVPATSIRLGLRRRWLAIPGSTGQPRDGNPASCYALFDDDAHALTYFRVPYDHVTAARKIREAGLPEFFGVRLQVGY